MLKTRDICQISALPKHFDVDAMASNLTTNKRADESLNEDNTETGYVLKPRHARLGKRAANKLLSEVQDRCKETPIVETLEDVQINATEFKKYQEGQIIFVKEDSRKRLCERTAYSNEGPDACGYGFPNPNNIKFSFHQVSSGSIQVRCLYNSGGPPYCGEPETDEYCLCDDLIDKLSAQACGNFKR